MHGSGFFTRRTLFGLLAMIASVYQPILAQKQMESVQSLHIKISFGHLGPGKTKKIIELKSSTPGMTISNVTGKLLELEDKIEDEVVVLSYGERDIDELMATITWNKPTAELLKISSMQMWPYLMEHGSAGQIKRLKKDPWNIPDAPILTVQMDRQGIEGFSFSVEQLQLEGAMWLPEQDVYITLADIPINFDKHLASLKGLRTLEDVNNKPDATYDFFKTQWSDFGNPNTYDPWWQTKYKGTTGHLIVTAAAQGSIYKFAVDRWGKVRPDFASPYKFRLNPTWEGSQWVNQEIDNGLPIIITQLEKNGQYLKMEQFVSPLRGLNPQDRGNIPSVFFTKVNITGKPGNITYQVSLNTEVDDQELELRRSSNILIVADQETENILLTIESPNNFSAEMVKGPGIENGRVFSVTINGQVKNQQSMELLLKLPSPALLASDSTLLQSLDFQIAKNKIETYWNYWIDQGAQFHVPEKEVNELFRANLWHALILPRHTIDSNGKDHMDLPYSNVAYGQTNADWPINQGVYVDYMIYGLRGYSDVAQEETKSIFQTQQQPDGRIGGYADWGVYSPGHLYTIAQNYLLSRNNIRFEETLPQSLNTLDWILAKIAESKTGRGASGLILNPLNDLTTVERAWAFTQAYYTAGLELFGRALNQYHHPRANEVLGIASQMKKDVLNAFARGSVKSPIVQLADGTWINYVPTDALTPRRMLDEWYPTDVDTGPLHLSRLGVFEPHSWLTTAMLNDHEDNLYLHNRGAANEPIYVQQSTAYLLRDEPKAAIRSFYSLMASAFSRGQLSPLEHRWAHGQYYGPPSTDGAWFELYRKMLINEIGDDTLMIGQAIPRAWLENGNQITVKNAPTYFGEVSFSIQGVSDQNDIVATVELSDQYPPKELWIRFRHPDKKPIRYVTVNGLKWNNFDVEKERIRIPTQDKNLYVISANY